MTLRSITYPLTASNGTLAFSEDSRVLVERIFSVLETRPSERIERPEYGSPNFLFSNVNTETIILGRIEVALLEQIPELRGLNLSGSIADNVITVNIEFDYQATLQSLTIQIAL